MVGCVAAQCNQKVFFSELQFHSLIKGQKFQLLSLGVLFEPVDLLFQVHGERVSRPPSIEMRRKIGLAKAGLVVPIGQIVIERVIFVALHVSLRYWWLSNGSLLYFHIVQ